MKSAISTFIFAGRLGASTLTLESPLLDRSTAPTLNAPWRSPYPWKAFLAKASSPFQSSCVPLDLSALPWAFQLPWGICYNCAALPRARSTRGVLNVFAMDFRITRQIIKRLHKSPREALTCSRVIGAAGQCRLPYIPVLENYCCASSYPHTAVVT